MTKGMEANEKQPAVLIADDDKNIRKLLEYNLSNAGFKTVLANDGNETIARLSEDISVVLLDLRMPGISGMECLRHIKKSHRDIQAIVVTASNDVGDAVEAMKSGAFDYVTKPVNLDALLSLVRQAFKNTRLIRENQQLKQVIGDSKPKTGFIGNSPATNDLRSRIEKIAPLTSTVLVTGESGVGKGLLSRMIHYAGPRADKPFVTVSCTALPRDLVESELFGHEKGAFTGAHEKRIGRLELANGGTLFLDEIGDLPLELQPKLLNFLQDRFFYRIGGTVSVHVDIRVIAASHHNLQALCKEKKFREDLYFRLNIVPLHLPPLRRRREDIPLLARHLLERINQQRGGTRFKLEDNALDALMRYNWPGNVRELENVLEQTAAFCASSTITREDLPTDIWGISADKHSQHATLSGLALDEIEKMAILQTLEMYNGNKAKSARSLGISEKSIYNKIKRLGLSDKE